MSRGETLSFYLDKTKAQSYLEMREGLDGRILVEQLCTILPRGASLLELGIGPGNDLLMLSEHFDVAGSDYSNHFLDKFKEKDRNIPLYLLDAVTIETNHRFDCIFSNKVLHHLNKLQLLDSLKRQTEVVRPGGILLHSFWLGEGNVTAEGLVFQKYSTDEIHSFLSAAGTVICGGKYAEINSKDSYFAAVRADE